MTEIYPDEVILENIMENEAMDTFLEEPEFLTDNSTLAPLVKMSTIAATTMKATMSEQNKEVEDLKQSMDTFFILINSIVVFVLQGGFAFLEAGSVRAKNTTNILIKNILDCLVGAFAFWAFGFMIANSEGNSFMGWDTRYICMYDLDNSMYAQWFFGFVFCATAATIVSGAVAERCELTAYFVYSTVICIIVYPTVVHWAWTSEGWLAVNGYYDFAGSGVVHHLGGVCALMGAVFLGPRIGRFDDPNRPVTSNIPGHSVSLAALGAFILMFGFFAFNGGTNAAISTEEDRNIVQRAVVNTIIGGMSSGFITLLAFRFTVDKKWSLLSTINGALCGMIATCATCNVAETWTTFILGFFAAFFYIGIHYSMIWFRIDDPLDAVAVHSGGGMCGVLAAPFIIGAGGIFDPDKEISAMHQIWSQVVGLLLITAWSGTITSLIFFFLRLNNKLRLPREVEIAGCDVIKHGEAAYPAEAYENDQFDPHFKKAEVKEFTIAEVTSERNEKVWGSLKKKLQRTSIRDNVSIPVTPLAFKKLENDSSSGSERSSRKCRTQILSGIDNNAFEDSVDYTGQNNINKTYQETHFGEEKKDVTDVNDVTNKQLTLVAAADRTIDFNNSKESSMI